MASNDRNGTPSGPAASVLKRYKHPFTGNGDWQYYASKDDDPTEKDTPRTLAELRMCALSAAIRQKPEWWVKFRDEEVQAKWTEEIKEQQKDMHRSLQLTDNMIHYILGELDAYAALRDPETGVEPGPYERIWQSDQLVPASLKASLVSAVAPLDLDLVHPSLYPVVYGRTTTRGFEETLQPRATDVAAMFRSERFQWLPSDFHVEEDGTVKLASPYINNIHPEDHKALTELPTRLDLKGRKFPGCVWPNGHEPYLDEDTRLRFIAEHDRLRAEDRKVWEAGRDKFLDDEWDVFLATCPSEDEKWVEPPYSEFKEVNYFVKLLDEWLGAQAEHLWPDSKPSYDGGLDGVKKTVDLRGKTLHVIVKLANIVLTPEKPEYSGGTWHVEGMDNEAIVSTFIYYYDTENITDSTLSFRNAVNEPRYHAQFDYYCMQHLYNINVDQICVQTVGQVTTKQDRCIAFPNIYHTSSRLPPRRPHQARPPQILVFFLVDPNITFLESTNLWWRLPFELQEMVWERLDLLTEEQAKQYREELMKERTLIVKTVDEQRFGQTFNLCEH
ncbi:uncharacterized protein B0H18DRAFT_1215946 [Fomitopsis serialis]|uniref:uncharacterized protein n=1 Tax=Fomitopsis serialis TaxID=139415 RepID=UPI0020075BEA|nr:uncharacterized protein B0H18DRAFT_1215946 [Neoantrodia serialis]KAH9914461.1 hypothetical protein B0H18DRAFT_1215946 [Neoantrodia serialis]